MLNFKELVNGVKSNAYTVGTYEDFIYTILKSFTDEDDVETVMPDRTIKDIDFIFLLESGRMACKPHASTDVYYFHINDKGNPEATTELFSKKDNHILFRYNAISGKKCYKEGENSPEFHEKYKKAIESGVYQEFPFYNEIK